MNNWAKLCENVKTLMIDGVPEDLFHRLFESFLKTTFHWDDLSIKHKLPVQMGREKKEADIVLEGKDFGIVIEMKRPSLTLGDEEAAQLISYMTFLRKKFGLLIGNKIQVFYDEENTDDSPIRIASFGFEVDNPNGIALGEVLDKSICSNEKLKEYAQERIRESQKEQEVEDLKTELLENNGKKIKDIVIEKLISEGYEEKYILNMFDFVNITIPNTNIENISDYQDPPGEKTLTPAVIAETYYYNGYGSKAVLKIHGNNSFVVLKGSRISSKVKPYMKTITKKRAEYNNVISHSFELIEDIPFSTLSGAANFVSGASLNGWVEWKTSSGKTIYDLNAE